MSSSVEVPSVELNDGRRMPKLALGTYLGFDKDGIVKPKDNNVRDLVSRAIEVGYRNFDTAAVYQTEEQVGEGVLAQIENGNVSRDDIFVTTKLWNTHHEEKQVEEAIKTSLKFLGLDYVDLYLMHWPMGLNEDYTFSDVDYIETWKGMEEVQKQGLAKSIGVSNFNKTQLERVIKKGSVKPAVIQIEVHPQMVQKELVEYAQSEGVVVMGYSPFGSLVSRPGVTESGPKIDNPTLMAMAEKYKKTTPQVVLRWLIDRDIVPVPKTINPKRLEENIQVFDFKLEEDEIEKINAFNDGTRYTLPSFWQTHPYYPFEKIDDPAPNPFVKEA